MPSEHPATPSDAYLDALATLQTRLVDALAGYRKLRDRAEPEIRPLADDFIRLHTAHEEELASRLRAAGREPDEDGSFFSAVQKAVVETRAFFSDIGANVLPQVVSGEERILDLYRRARAQAGAETDARMLERQMSELEALDGRARSRAHP